jgi:two-component system sensor histidine kinase TtrS
MQALTPTTPPATPAATPAEPLTEAPCGARPEVRRGAPGRPARPGPRGLRGWLALTALALFAWASTPGLAPAWAEGASDPAEVRIGVLSARGADATLRLWTPTADYLSAALADRRFRILPLGFDEVIPAARDRLVDFMLVNPALYVHLTVDCGVSRIATLRGRSGSARQNRLGGVVFARAERTELEGLRDLKGRSLVAVDPDSLGGFQLAWDALLQSGIDPGRDLGRLHFAGTHDAAVLAVLGGEYDAGTVRTDTLERMDAEGRIRLADVRVLAPRTDPGFPLLHSTALYPEWAFATIRETPEGLTQRVAVALLGMPADHEAALAGGYAGWTVPLDYHPVHELLRRLRLPPYDTPTPFTLRDAMARWWVALLLGLAALGAMTFLTLWVVRLNRRLRRAKTSLEQQRDLILSSVAEGIFGVDLKGRTTFVNKAMAELTGFSPEELIGADPHRVLHHSRADGRRHPHDQCPVHATYRDSQARFVEDDCFWRRDGTGFPVEYSATPIRDEGGATLGAVVVFRDMTERRRAAERIRLHQSELAHVARLSTLGEMASGIAHELNQPLTAIATNARACVRMIEAGTAGEQCGDVLERIADQAERAGEIIRQIRHFARKESPLLRPTRVTAILRTVVGLIEPDAERAGIELTVESPPEEVWVKAQEIQIEQVLLNLARNAIEAMEPCPPPRRLVLAALPQAEGQIELSVCDTGPGLAPGIRDRLFEPFVTTKPLGMGLGLSIGAGIVQAHGAELNVRSEPGAGASFRFTLPTVQAL